MSELENDGHHHLSLFSENERYTCSSPFTLKPTETNATLEVDFEDSCQDAEEPYETDFKVSLKDDRRYTQEHRKVELNFKDIKQKNPVESKHISEERHCEKSLKNEQSCLEDGEVVETGETTADLEEGEIKETRSEKTVETYNCRYYQMGSCLYGKDCRFFHVSDKGLYSMFDLSVSAQNKVPHPTQFSIKQNGVSSPSVFEVETTSWDKALKEAMDRVESKKKVALGRENLCMTIQSGGCTNEKNLSREFPPKNSLKRTYAGKTRGSSLNKRKTAYEISPVRSKSSARDSIDTRCSFIKSKTPRNMRWSPKSSSCSCKSRSRSRSSSALSSKRSSTASPKRGHRIISSSVTKNYRKKYSSSSSKSPSRSYTTNTGSRRFKRRRQEYSSHFKSSKMSDCRSPVKILLSKRLERERRRLSRREIPRRVLPPKSQVASKSTSPYTKPRDKSCSDMSISPLSDQKGGCIEDFSAAYCSDRHVSDMSISPLSSPSRASCQIEVENYTVSESKVENLEKSIIRKKSPNGQELILSAQQENSTLEISPNSSSNVSKPTPGTKLKNNSLVINLGKIQRNFKRNDSFEGMKNVTKTKLRTTSEFVDRPSNHTEIKVQQKANTIQSKLSRKEMLLKRLQEVNEAIKRKKVTQLGKK